MTRDQQRLVADLRRNQQGFTADRVAALGEASFENFKRDILRRFAAEGIFSAWRAEQKVTP
jgi:hypothetical protein